MAAMIQADYRLRLVEGHQMRPLGAHQKVPVEADQRDFVEARRTMVVGHQKRKQADFAPGQRCCKPLVAEN